MKKFFLLTSLAFSCCLLCVAQQELHTNDSAVDKQQAAVGGDGSAFTNFSVEVKEPNKVSLQWNVEHVSEGDYFVIERSADGNSYETIGVLRKEGNSDHYELMDN